MATQSLGNPVASGSSLKMSSSSQADATGAMVTKRLTSELMTLMMANHTGISAFPESDANMLRWVGQISGAEGTVYAGLTFKISINFPSNYPYAPPLIRFETPCYHPNVAYPGGDICLDILKDKWSSVLDVSSVLLSLQSLLGEPNNASPLNVEAADTWDNQEEFKKALMKAYRPPDSSA